jgi:hypothetical protein
MWHTMTLKMAHEYFSRQKKIQIFGTCFLLCLATVYTQYNIQMEVTKLKCITILKGKYEELPVIPTADDTVQFWKLLPYENFLQEVCTMITDICHFSCTYLCEQTFSSVKQIKDKQWYQLTHCKFTNWLFSQQNCNLTIN